LKLDGILGIILACLFFSLGCLVLLWQEQGYHGCCCDLPDRKSSDHSTEKECSLGDGLPEAPSHTHPIIQLHEHMSSRSRETFLMDNKNDSDDSSHMDEMWYQEGWDDDSLFS
jgi:hypothetical protein